MINTAQTQFTNFPSRLRFEEFGIFQYSYNKL